MTNNRMSGYSYLMLTETNITRNEKFQYGAEYWYKNVSTKKKFLQNFYKCNIDTIVRNVEKNIIISYHIDIYYIDTRNINIAIMLYWYLLYWYTKYHHSNKSLSDKKIQQFRELKKSSIGSVQKYPNFFQRILIYFNITKYDWTTQTGIVSIITCTYIKKSISLRICPKHYSPYITLISQFSDLIRSALMYCPS